MCRNTVLSTKDKAALYSPIEVCRASQPVSSINHDREAPVVIGFLYVVTL